MMHCLCCHHACAGPATTCPKCGEGSWCYAVAPTPDPVPAVEPQLVVGVDMAEPAADFTARVMVKNGAVLSVSDEPPVVATPIPPERPVTQARKAHRK